MSLCKYFEEIESLRFQVQFSVVGGLKILLWVMERNPTLVALRSAISGNDTFSEEVFERIVFLLGKVDSEELLSYDESIAAYLFCLSRENTLTAYRASWRIINFGGLWWSVRLAHHVKDTVREIFDSIDTSDDESETVPFSPSRANDELVEQRILIAYVFELLSESVFSTRDTFAPLTSPSSLRFGYKARDHVPSKKTFEINEPSDRLGYLELTR